MVRVLERLRGADADEGLRHCVLGRDIEGAAQALRALSTRLNAKDMPTVARFLGDSNDSMRLAAAIAAGYLGSPLLAQPVAGLLSSHSPELRSAAAISLGVMGAKDYAMRVVEQLRKESGHPFTACVAALELLAVREVVPELVKVLRTASADQIFDLTHALRVITGVDPNSQKVGIIRWSKEIDQLKSVWLRAAKKGHLDRPPPPAILAPRLLTANIASFYLAYGRGLVRIDYNPPQPGTNWIRWSRSLMIADVPVYELGSTCGTCEFFLSLASWPSHQLSDTARQMETATATAGLVPWIATWAPLSEQLRSGRYLVGQILMPVERIDRAGAASSWLHRRRAEREDSEEYEAAGEDEIESDWPGSIHYQGPRAGKIPTYPIIMPTQDPEKLSQSRIGEYQQLIASGERPPVVVFGWFDGRTVALSWEEQFLSLIILNGHHRLEAYVREGVPVPLIVVARADESWGPPDDPDKNLRETLTYFAPPGGTEAAL